jgi:hypothetical protein
LAKQSRGQAKQNSEACPRTECSYDHREQANRQEVIAAFDVSVVINFYLCAYRLRTKNEGHDSLARSTVITKQASQD